MRLFFRSAILPLLFLAFNQPLAAQTQKWFKTIPPGSPEIPAWAQLMYAANPNVRQIDSAYRAYYTAHPFEKNTHTQNYKHWRRQAEPYLNAAGQVEWPSLEAQQQDEKRYRQLLQSHPPQRQAGSWSNLGPFETYNQGTAQFKVSWQANAYTLDVAKTNPDILYCGTESGGIFRSDNQGLLWRHISANTMMATVRIVRISPNDADIAYAGDWDRLYRTTDGGNTWELLLETAGLGVNGIAISPADEQQLIVAGQKGLWRSDDSGQSWQQLFNNPVYDIEFKPDDPQVLYLVRGNTAQKRCEFLKSIDGGQSWTIKDAGWYLPPNPNYSGLADGGAKLAVSPLSPNLIVAGLIGNSKAGDDGYLGLWKSLDGGETWGLQGPHVGGPYEYSGGPGSHKNIMINEGGGGPYQGFYDFVLAISPFNPQIIYIGGVSLYKSTNGGNSFNVIGGYQGNTWIHPDMQEIAVSPNGVWLATDGGIDFTANEFITVESRKNGITASEFWGFGSGWNEDLLVGGRYHNGNTALRPSFPAGTALRLGGAEAPTGYVNPGRGIAYFSDISSQAVPHSIDGAVASLPSLQFYPLESYFAAHSSKLEFDPRCYNHLYLGLDHQLWKSEDGGASFSAIGTFGNEPGRPVLQFEISRSNPHFIYVYQRTSFYGATLWHTQDGGQSWQQRAFPNGVSSQRAGGMALNPENENELWVSFAHNYNDGAKVFRTIDGGQSWANLTTPTLNGHVIHTIFYQAGTDGAVYLGTDKAVFYRDNSMTDWSLYNDGLPMRTNANTLRPYYRENKLRLATYGNGIWETELAVPSSPLAQPTVDKLWAGCARDTFYFDDYSVLRHAGASWAWSISPAPAYVSALDVRNPKVVFGIEGSYTVGLTVTDAAGQSDSRTIENMVMVEACRPDTIPGLALSLQQSGDYATVEGLPINGNELTITAWIKPQGIQDEYTGIAITSSGPAAGFNFRPEMELGYHWPGGAWWWSSGLKAPADEWSYVAMVVRPNGIELYLNGKSALHSFNAEPVDFSALATYLGSYRGWESRNFRGLIDEVRFYQRALTTEEIRLRRHLTSQPDTDEGLAAYFQFNESQGPALNKLGNQHALPSGFAGRSLSTAPLGSGNSQQLLLQAPGTYNFSQTGLSLAFAPGAVLPNGPVVATRLQVPPDFLPGQEALPPSGYWIINNYGMNSGWGPLQSLRLSGLPIPVGAENQTAAFTLLHRPDNGEGDHWISAITGATEAVPGPTDGQLAFSTNNNDLTSGQLLILQSDLVGMATPSLPSRYLVYPNPVSAGQELHVATNQTGPYVFELFDSGGKLLLQANMEGPARLQLPADLPAGLYTYRAKGERFMSAGKIIYR